MNNIELENKIKELLSIENYFDMVVAMKKFELEYKKSDFFKETKMPLDIVVKQAKIHYALQLNELGQRIQKLLDNLSLDNINNLLDKIGMTFGQENADIKELIKDFADLKN